MFLQKTHEVFFMLKLTERFFGFFLCMNPGLLSRRHWQSEALSIRQGLIHTRPDLIYCSARSPANMSGGSPFVSRIMNVLVCVGLVRCFSGGVVGGNRGWRNETPAGSKTEVSVFRGRIKRQTWCIGPYAVAEYNLTLTRLQSRPQHIYHGQPYARVDFNHMSKSALSSSQGLRMRPRFCSAEVSFKWGPVGRCCAYTPLTWIRFSPLLRTYCRLVQIGTRMETPDMPHNWEFMCWVALFLAVSEIFSQNMCIQVR